MFPSLGAIKVIVSRVGTKQENNKRNLVSPEDASRILSAENEARYYSRVSTETWSWGNK